MSDSKSPQISRTLFNILVDLNNAVVWTVSTCPVISKSSSPCTNPLETIPRAPITIDIIITFMFHSFSIPQQGVKVLIPLFTLFNFTLQQRPQFCKFSLFCRLLWDLVIWSRFGDLFVSQNLTGVCASHFPGQILGCAYGCSYGQTSTSCTIPSGSPCPIFYSFWANLLHLLIMRLIVLSLSPHNLHLLFCCVLSILTLISLISHYGIVLSWRDSVSLFRFSFLKPCPHFYVYLTC